MQATKYQLLEMTETMERPLTQHAINRFGPSADAQTRDRFLNELSEGEPCIS